jgi:anthranilate synthase component 1
MVKPTLDEVKSLAQQGNVIPVCTRILADTETPVSVWLKLFADEPYSFLLESVTGGDKVARYSFIGGKPFLTFKSNKK